MDLYSLERLTLERHREMAMATETRARALGYRAEPRLPVLLANRLRRLADRLDRPTSEARPSLNVVSGSR